MAPPQIVQLGKVIQIEQDHARAGGACEQVLGQAVLEQRAVGQPRQHIVVGLVTELFFLVNQPQPKQQIAHPLVEQLEFFIVKGTHLVSKQRHDGQRPVVHHQRERGQRPATVLEQLSPLQYWRGLRFNIVAKEGALFTRSDAPRAIGVG